MIINIPYRERGNVLQNLVGSEKKNNKKKTYISGMNLEFTTSYFSLRFIEVGFEQHVSGRLMQLYICFLKPQERKNVGNR